MPEAEHGIPRSGTGGSQGSQEDLADPRACAEEAGLGGTGSEFRARCWRANRGSGKAQGAAPRGGLTTGSGEMAVHVHVHTAPHRASCLAGWWEGRKRGSVTPAAGSELGRLGGCGEEPQPPPPPRPQGQSLGLDVQTLVSRKPSFPTKWAGKSPHLVIAFPRGRSPRCWPPSQPQGPGLLGSDRQRPGCPRELMEGRGWAEEACTGVKGSPGS